MGSIRSFNLPELVQQYGLTYFVETGTGLAEGLQHAHALNQFKKCYSCEIEKEIFEKVAHLNDTEGIMIYHLESKAYLEKVLKDIPMNEPCLFWLDAHYPGADFKIRGYKDEPNLDLCLPLETELKKIVELRKSNKDVFILDDLRIYEDGPFEGGNLPEFAAVLSESMRNIDFVDELFSSTHKISRDYREEGYLILTPYLEDRGHHG